MEAELAAFEAELFGIGALGDEEDDGEVLPTPQSSSLSSSSLQSPAASSPLDKKVWILCLLYES